ncbi:MULTISPECIES: hypothetical protein [Nonomuraea]|uniref:Uncharacterized protein n=1 Tax=Nonomuraea mangrovi TaxID=2316207 RepID=A0ABW4SNK0_9ACTN
MTKAVLLTSLVAGALTGPALVQAPATLAIKEITIRPGAPVVGAHGSVKLVIDVVASGAEENGVTIKVEPGSPPGPVLGRKPIGSGKILGPVPEAPPARVALVPVEAVPPPEDLPPAFAAPRPAIPAPPDGWGQPSAAGGDAMVEDWPAPVEPSFPAAQPPPPGWPEETTTPAPEPTPSATPSGPDGQPIGRDGVWETWRFLPAQGLNRFYPAGPWTITATARAEDGTSVTAYASFNLRRDTKLSPVLIKGMRGGRGVRLSGSLHRIDPSGTTDYAPFAKQRLEIFYRRGTNGSWQRVGTVTTGDRGQFERRLAGRTQGTWRVRFPGTDSYAAEQASTLRRVVRN